MLFFHAEQIKSIHSDPRKDSELAPALSTNNCVGIDNHLKKRHNNQSSLRIPHSLADQAGGKKQYFGAGPIKIRMTLKQT